VTSPRDGTVLSMGKVSGARLVRDSAEMTTGEVDCPDAISGERSLDGRSSLGRYAMLRPIQR
jgi:hypothetical protein